MSFEYFRKEGRKCRDHTSQEKAGRCWFGLSANESNWLNGWGASKRPLSRVDTITLSGEVITFITPGFNPEAAA
jgi:hypothetical protein